MWAASPGALRRCPMHWGGAHANGRMHASRSGTRKHLKKMEKPRGTRALISVMAAPYHVINVKVLRDQCVWHLALLGTGTGERGLVLCMSTTTITTAR